MNKEQAKATIESESLLRQEAKNSIRGKTGPVSDNKFADDTLHSFIEHKQADIILNEPDDKLAGELYVEAKYQAKRYERITEGPKEIKTDGPSNNVTSTKYEVAKGKKGLTKTKFTNKRKQTALTDPTDRPKPRTNGKYDIKNDNKNSSKLFEVTEDKLSDAIAIKRKTNTKLTEAEIRQKAYFANKLESKNEPVRNEISEDDRIVYKTFGRNRKNMSRYTLGTFRASKYHVNNVNTMLKDDYQNDDESIQDDVMYKASAVSRTAANTTNRMYKGISTKKIQSEPLSKKKKVTNSKFIPVSGTRHKKDEIVAPLDLMIQERKNMLRFISIKKHEEQVFTGIKTSLARKIFSKIKEIATRNKIGVIIGAVCLAFILAAIGSVGVLVEGISQATGVYLSGLSLSTDFDMTDCENYYTKMESDLQEVLDNIEEYYPGYDRYVIDFDDEIGHDALKLMAYLSAVYEGYDLSLIQGVLDDLFDDMYIIETDEETLIEDEEEIKVFSFKIKKTDWDTLMASRISDTDKDLYDSYEKHGGGHQAFHNPFDINWANKITSEFGWRIHPISGEEKFHKGVDIGMPSGTPVKSCSEGVVVKSTCTSVEGNYVVVMDETGYKCHYMHLSERNVNEGDVVDYDTIIGSVGSTGYSTGPHLHLQITDQNGECLNPKFLVQGGY